MLKAKLSGRSSGVERNLAKVEVEGSNPFARSKNRGFFTLKILGINQGIKLSKHYTKSLKLFFVILRDIFHRINILNILYTVKMK